MIKERRYVLFREVSSVEEKALASKTQVPRVREFEVRLIPRVLTRKFVEQLLTTEGRSL